MTTEQADEIIKLLIEINDKIPPMPVTAVILGVFLACIIIISISVVVIK